MSHFTNIWQFIRKAVEGLVEGTPAILGYVQGGGSQKTETEISIEHLVRRAGHEAHLPVPSLRQLARRVGWNTTPRIGDVFKSVKRGAKVTVEWSRFSSEAP